MFSKINEMPSQEPDTENDMQVKKQMNPNYKNISSISQSTKPSSDELPEIAEKS